LITKIFITEASLPEPISTILTPRNSVSGEYINSSKGSSIWRTICYATPLALVSVFSRDRSSSNSNSSVDKVILPLLLLVIELEEGLLIELEEGLLELAVGRVHPGRRCAIKKSFHCRRN
jgi:hypothetical protein